MTRHEIEHLASCLNCPIIIVSGCLNEYSFDRSHISTPHWLGDNHGFYGWNWSAYLMEAIDPATHKRKTFIFIHSYLGNTPKSNLELYSSGGDLAKCLQQEKEQEKKLLDFLFKEGRA